MSERLNKRIRKAINKKVKYDLTEVAKAICQENFFRRVGYAMRIIFKYKIGTALKPEVKRG